MSWSADLKYESEKGHQLKLNNMTYTISLQRVKHLKDMRTLKRSQEMTLKGIKIGTLLSDTPDVLIFAQQSFHIKSSSKDKTCEIEKRSF